MVKLDQRAGCGEAGECVGAWGECEEAWGMPMGNRRHGDDRAEVSTKRIEIHGRDEAKFFLKAFGEIRRAAES